MMLKRFRVGEIRPFRTYGFDGELKCSVCKENIHLLPCYLCVEKKVLICEHIDCFVEHIRECPSKEHPQIQEAD